jgi:hypothetical protein
MVSRTNHLIWRQSGWYLIWNHDQVVSNNGKQQEQEQKANFVQQTVRKKQQQM